LRHGDSLVPRGRWQHIGKTARSGPGTGPDDEGRIVGSLDGKVAIVTGAARGQGRAEAELFAREGATVVLADVLDDVGAAAAAAIGRGARYTHLDVTDEDAWEQAVADTVAETGGVDVLVNNAAVFHRRALEDETVDGMQQLWSVNLLGPFLGMRTVAAAMRERGGGSIVNVSSAAGLTGFAWQSAYGSTKWALRGLTKVAAIELGASGIRVNSVHPGVVDTEMIAGLHADRFTGAPLARCAQPEEIAAVVRFLASDEASYLTGAELAVDGGMLAGPPPTPRPS
jgi:3alpha(or 20beta)-hydroxysteroid dehydrogenase